MKDAVARIPWRNWRPRLLDCLPAYTASSIPRPVVIRLRNMTAIDATGLHALKVFSDRLRRSGRTLLFCGARRQPAQLLMQAEFVDHIGAENILPDVQTALDRGARDRRELFRCGSGRRSSPAPRVDIKEFKLCQATSHFP